MSQETSIEWGKSWNPVKGLCPHREHCFYCYMTQLDKRFKFNHELRMDDKVLRNPPKNVQRVFVCSNIDLFADKIDTGYILDVFDVVKTRPDQDFLFLTKNPVRYCEIKINLELPNNGWFGTTWDGLPFTIENVKTLKDALPKRAARFVSFEPLYSDPRYEELVGLDWIIIGADSRRGVKKPPLQWAKVLIEKARELEIPVFVKRNYGYPEVIQEFPE